MANNLKDLLQEVETSAGTGTGAATDLSNLTETAINETLKPADDNVIDNGTSLLRWASSWSSFCSATDSLGLRDTAGNPIMSLALGGPFFGLYTGPFWQSPTNMTGTDSFGFRGRNINNTGTHNLIMFTGSAFIAGNSGKIRGITGNAQGGDSGNIEWATGSAFGTRGEFIIDARQVNVSNKNIVNVAAAVNQTDAVNKTQLEAGDRSIFFATLDGSTIQLTVNQNYISAGGGSGTTTFKLPSMTGVTSGKLFKFLNKSPTHTMIVTKFDDSSIVTLPPQTAAEIMHIGGGDFDYHKYAIIVP